MVLSSTAVTWVCAGMTVRTAAAVDALARRFTFAVLSSVRPPLDAGAETTVTYLPETQPSSLP